MEFIGGNRHLSFEPKRYEPVSLERFWDEVAWQRRQLEEGDTLVPDPESRCFLVRYRSGGLPAERSERVTTTGTETLFLKQHQWGEGTGKVGCGDCGALVRVSRRDPAKLADGELADRVVDLAEALDAEIYCAVFNADWTNLALGTSRNASDAQRLILAARDGGCAHCNAHTEATHAHHNHPHAAGGQTTITNLQLLCAPCHTHHHQTDHEHDHDEDTHRGGRPTSRSP